MNTRAGTELEGLRCRGEGVGAWVWLYAPLRCYIRRTDVHAAQRFAARSLRGPLRFVSGDHSCTVGDKEKGLQLKVLLGKRTST